MGSDELWQGEKSNFPLLPHECAKQTFHYNKSHCIRQGARCYSNRFTIESRGQCSGACLSNRETGNIFLVPISGRVGKRGRERERGRRKERKRKGGRKTAFRVTTTMILRGMCWSWILNVPYSGLEVRGGLVGLICRWLCITYNVCQKCGNAWFKGRSEGLVWTKLSFIIGVING